MTCTAALLLFVLPARGFLLPSSLAVRRTERCYTSQPCMAEPSKKTEKKGNVATKSDSPQMEGLVDELKSFVERMAAAKEEGGQQEGEAPGATEGETETHMSTFYASDCMIVDRPTGDLHDMPTWKRMYMSQSTQDGALISADNVKVFADGKAGVVTYTAATKRGAKGDPVKISAVFEKKPEGWKCIEEHRAVGQEAVKALEPDEQEGV